MTSDQFLWVLARVAGLSSYAALAVALLTGIALRTAVLDWLGRNRVLRSVHEYTTVLWIPLAALHLIALLFDRTSRIGIADLFVPFHSEYGALAIGLGAHLHTTEKQIDHWAKMVDSTRDNRSLAFYQTKHAAAL